MGAPVKVHVTLTLAVVVGVVWAVETSSFAIGLALAIYLASLAMHEAAHAVCAARVGGRFDRVVLGPAGGLCSPLTPPDPKSQVFVAMAGPLSHLALVVASGCYLALRNDGSLPLLITSGGGNAADLFNSASDPAILLARIAIAVNWPLFVLNLLPARPFDGELALRGWLSQWLGSLTAEELARRAAFSIGVLLMIGSLLATGQAPGDDSSPLSLATAMAALGVLLLYSGSLPRPAFSPHTLFPNHQQLQDPAGRDLQDLPRWAEQDAGSMVLVEIRGAKIGQDELEEADCDESRLDALLAKVHAQGIDHLTPEERSILEQASRHYRRRRTT